MSTERSTCMQESCRFWIGASQQQVSTAMGLYVSTVLRYFGLRCRRWIWVALLGLATGCTDHTIDSGVNGHKSHGSPDRPADSQGVIAKNLAPEASNAQSEGVRPQASLRVQSHSAIHFEPMPSSLLPDVVPENGSRHGYATILESLGSGGAAIDVDEDDLPDVLVAGGGDFEGRSFVGRPIFFLKNRRSFFSNNTEPSGLRSSSFYHHGLAAADYDHDGFQDFLILGYGGLQFFRNLGDGTFEDASTTAELTAHIWSASAAWGDFNRDGHLDVYVTGYVNWSFENDPPCFAADGIRRDNCSPRLFDAIPDQLFLNLGDGRFSNATSEFGVRGDGKALGVVAADLDLDGFVDVYVGNDVMANCLYQNQAGQRFVDRSISSGACVSSRGSPDASMGVEAVDYNLDGRPDLWSANFEMESFALYQNQGNMLFRHISESAGISAIGEQYVGWGSVFADFDLDGDEDLCVCNGNVVRYPVHSPALQRMLVMENIEGTYFNDVTESAGESLLTPRNGRGLAVLDWNGDGLSDLLITPTGSPAVLYTNTSPGNGQWLTLELIGTQSPRHPIGAIVELTTSVGVRYRQLKGGGSYASTSSPDVHFGIPPIATVSEITIRWPSGRIQVITSPVLNSRLRVIESSNP